MTTTARQGRRAFRAGVIDFDTFTDSDGVFLADHIPDKGEKWVGLRASFDIENNSAVWLSGQEAPTGSTPKTMARKNTLTSCNVSTDIIIPAGEFGVSVFVVAGLLLRYQDLDNWVSATIIIPNATVKQVTILVCNAGVVSLVDAYTGQPYTEGNTYRMSATVAGNTIQVYIDGVAKSFLDSSFLVGSPAQGLFVQTNAPRNDASLDNFEIR